MERNVKFSISDVQKIRLEDYAEDEFAIARLGFLSTRPNSHELLISEDVLRQSAPSVLGKWVIADMTSVVDAGTHTDNQIIVGRVPENQSVEFVEDKDGYLRAYVDTIISKVYARDYCAMFEGDNDRAVSVEMMCEMSEENENEVLSFRIVGVTTLGHAYRPSCPESNITFTRFSEEEAEAFFHKVHKNSLTALEQFAEDRKKLMGSNRKQADVNKTKFGASQNGKEADTKMEIEFAAVDIGDMWGKVWDALHAKYPDGDWGSVYRIDGIYEEDNKKFAIIHHKDDDAKYRLDFSLTEEGLTLAEEIVKVELEIVETDEVKKFAEPENADKYKKFEEKDDKQKDDEDDDDKDDDEEEVEMSADEMKAEMARLQSEIEKKENIIMEKDTKMGEMEKELSELREYKAACEKKELATSVETIMSEVKDCLSEDKYKEFRDEGLTCQMSELDAWSNKVKAFCFENGKVGKTIKKNDGVFSFAAPVETNQKPMNVWDRLKNL